MPISPIEIANRRHELTVNKLCDLIDKKLQECKDNESFEFHFNPSTSPEAKQSIIDIYKNAGWEATIAYSDTVPAGYLKLSNNIGFGRGKVDCPFDSKPKTRTAAENSNIIQKAFDSPEGRIALAQSMFSPIHLTINSSLHRKLLLFDDLPENIDHPMYECGDNPIYYCDGKICKFNSDYELNEFTSSVTIKIDKRKFYLLDKAQSSMAKSIVHQTNMALSMLLLDSVTTQQQIFHTYGETVKRAIYEAMGELEADSELPAKMILNPATYRRAFYPESYDAIQESPLRDLLCSGLNGHMSTMDIHCLPTVERDVIYIVPPASHLGVVAMNDSRDLIILPANQKNKSDEMSFVTSMRCLMAIINPENVKKVAIKW